MTETTGFVPQPDPAAGQVPYGQAAQAAAAQLAAQSQAVASDAGDQVAQMTDAQRAVLLPMEQKIDDLMAQFKATTDAQAEEIRKLQTQLGAAQSAVGPAAVEQYATSVGSLITAHAAAHDPAPFRPLAEAASRLVDLGKKALESRDGQAVVRAVDEFRRLITRSGAYPVDGSWASVHADLDQLELAAAKLA